MILIVVLSFPSMTAFDFVGSRHSGLASHFWGFGLSWPRCLGGSRPGIQDQWGASPTQIQTHRWRAGANRVWRRGRRRRRGRGDRSWRGQFCLCFYGQNSSPYHPTIMMALKNTWATREEYVPPPIECPEPAHDVPLPSKAGERGETASVLPVPTPVRAGTPTPNPPKTPSEPANKYGFSHKVMGKQGN